MVAVEVNGQTLIVPAHPNRRAVEMARGLNNEEVVLSGLTAAMAELSMQKGIPNNVSDEWVAKLSDRIRALMIKEGIDVSTAGTRLGVDDRLATFVSGASGTGRYHAFSFSEDDPEWQVHFKANDIRPDGFSR